jgi:hypothetical protein
VSEKGERKRCEESWKRVVEETVFIEDVNGRGCGCGCVEKD